ncbi:MAG: hypothetical protein ACD_4C00340G0001 [uncultured bacterium (gcode 4)]|uniref:Uncharacterized protein n=1 Tax=uncultured bacterium (gcode 4) TaxID=1234023 RepID=K2F5D1_9BACT|nr:MAG: hypothetical protein ACD_4C00340G0001 [uncultured bacterium (gcode 4)]
MNSCMFHTDIKSIQLVDVEWQYLFHVLSKSSQQALLLQSWSAEQVDQSGLRHVTLQRFEEHSDAAQQFAPSGFHSQIFDVHIPLAQLLLAEQLAPFGFPIHKWDQAVSQLELEHSIFAEQAVQTGLVVQILLTQ